MTIVLCLVRKLDSSKFKSKKKNIISLLNHYWNIDAIILFLKCYISELYISWRCPSWRRPKPAPASLCSGKPETGKGRKRPPPLPFSIPFNPRLTHELVHQQKAGYRINYLLCLGRRSSYFGQTRRLPRTHTYEYLLVYSPFVISRIQFEIENTSQFALNTLKILLKAI